MNKKEITEIKKQFTPENCAITRICGCYVNGEKEKQSTFKQAFLSLPEEEMFKYFDIFRKGLSGTLGKNLINMDFPLEAELNGGTHEFLLKLRESRLTDDMLLNTFFHCPNCGRFIVAIYESDTERGGGISNSLKGCSTCLQAIDFSEYYTKRDVGNNKLNEDMEWSN